jgi:hypothetical protein
VTEFSTGITPGSHPTGITSGPDGALWFTEFSASQIGRITTAGAVTEISSGITPGSEPAGIVTGSDGNVWFTEEADRIGRVNTAPSPSPPPPTNNNPPVNTSPPAISGTPLPDQKLTCSNGSWGNDPTSFKDRWNTNGAAIAGATSQSYTVQVADRGATLSCSVTATNAAGSTTVTSRGVLVAVPGTLSCPRPSGRLTTSRVGPLFLGESRATARKALRRFTKHGNGDDFCLYAGWGIRDFYPSNRTLSLVPGVQGMRSRIVVVLTANPFYSFHGISPGSSLKDAKRKLKLGRVHHIGLNDWYFNPSGNVLVKVRRNTILEIGPANTKFTHGYKLQQKFMNSFGSF